MHASLIGHLTSAGARVIAFSVPVDTSPRTSEAERLRAALALLESSDLGDSEQAQQLRRLLGESSAGRDPDAHLAQAIQAHGNVVLPADVRLVETSGGKSELPARLFSIGDAGALRVARAGDVVAAPTPLLARAAAAVGHTQTIQDGDGTVRSDAAALRVGEDALLPSLATAIAARAFGVAPADVGFASGNALELGEQVRPLAGRAARFARTTSRKTPAQFTQLPYWRVMAGDVPSNSCATRSCIVGFLDSALAAPGTVTTPASDASPTVLTTASTVTSVVAGKVYSRPTYAVALEWIVAIAVIAFAAFVLPLTGAIFGALATVLFIVILGVIEIGLLSSSLVWVRFMLPASRSSSAMACSCPASSCVARPAAARTRRTCPRTACAISARRSSVRASSTWRSRRIAAARSMPRRWSCCTSSASDFEQRRQMQKASQRLRLHRRPRSELSRSASASRAREGAAAHARNTADAAPQPQASTPPELATQPSDPDMAYAAPRHARATRRTLGRYEIERELGKGAMGVVYLGRDPKINRVVAIKAIPLAEEFEEDDLEEARARFFREAEMAGRLNHPASSRSTMRARIRDWPTSRWNTCAAST